MEAILHLLGYNFGGPCKKGCRILGSILGPPILKTTVSTSSYSLAASRCGESLVCMGGRAS